MLENIIFVLENIIFVLENIIFLFQDLAPNSLNILLGFLEIIKLDLFFHARWSEGGRGLLRRKNTGHSEDFGATPFLLPATDKSMFFFQSTTQGRQSEI